MNPDPTEVKFLSTPDKGDVSAILMRPEDATHLLVLGHGASSNMRTPMMETIAEHLAEQKIATFRYNFPYSEKGRRAEFSGCLYNDYPFGSGSGE
jgi:hypothetical protein